MTYKDTMGRFEKDPRKRIHSLRELRILLREDKRLNDRSIFQPGFQAMFVYRFGVWRESITFRPFRLPFTFLYRAAFVFVRNVYGIEIPYTTTIGRRLRVAHQHSIIVHPNAVIGDDCLIRQGVSIGISRSARPRKGRQVAPVLGDRVEVGAGAVIAGAITIGNDVTIGPNAVVLSDVPDNAIVTVSPPRTIPRPSGVKGPERLS